MTGVGGKQETATQQGETKQSSLPVFLPREREEVKVSSHKMQQGSSGASSMQSSGWVMKSPRLLWCAFALS